MDRHGNKPIPLTEGLGDFMKRFIILLSVIITILCGCGNTDENKVNNWKKAIHHEFVHSADHTQEQWNNDDLVPTCYGEEYSRIHLRKENPDDLNGFTWYANTSREESYAEHGGYISYMLSNPSEQNRKITIQYSKDGERFKKDINFEEYKKLYPRHYEYFTKKFNEESS